MPSPSGRAIRYYLFILPLIPFYKKDNFLELVGTTLELAGVKLELRGVKVFLATTIIELVGVNIEPGGEKLKLATVSPKCKST